MADDLLSWRRQRIYSSNDDYVFASETMRGKQPYWPDNLMKRHIRPVAKAIGIHKKIGWHTFRHSFGTLLKANGEDVKTVQELLRDANSRITLDAYTGSEFEQAGCTEQGCKDDGVRHGSEGRRKIPANSPVAGLIGPLSDPDLIVTVGRHSILKSLG